ncbi:BCCT family transporter [Streptomyces xiaopingdaonensis]|uniref:BCCT family transporter n=1 Tax=Streptomyces xiaopingdaonensis TaxID=1565415 RepID=UPI00192A97B6|nr:BCCT family transporter [Streptomyces xiaopingdaonensis]
MSTVQPAPSSAEEGAQSAKGGPRVKRPVFIPAVLIILVALGAATWIGAVYGEEATTTFTNVRDWIGTTVGWWYILVVTGCLVFAFWAAFSRIGKVRLGRDDERPEFSRMSWFAMLFSAGMGIGLVFNGVAEPLSHLVAPPEVIGNEAGSQAAANAAVGEALFHWGLHAWGIYAIVGLGLAYMTFRYGRPLSVRWLLEPIMGRRLIESWVGHVIDTFAIVGTVFGVATSLGMGVLQIQAGLGHLGWIEPSNILVLVLVVGITAMGTLSVVSGVDKGIRWLSNTNMGMAGLLGLAVLIIGPTVFLLRSMVQNIGEYAQSIPQLAFVTGAGAEDGWTLAWTLFNQAWFLSWAPFVGMFIARISRGRTIREFILGVLLAPTAVSLVWLTIFGNSGLFYQLKQGNLVGDDGVVNTDTTLFQMFTELPVGSGIVTVLCVIAIVVIMLFFITSADSCALVVDVLSHGGRSETPRRTRVFWAVLVGVSGGVLLLAGGESALTVLQVSSLAGAAPLSIVYALAMVALWKVFRYEVAVMPRYVKITTQKTGDQASRGGGSAIGSGGASSLRELVRSHEADADRTDRRLGAAVSLAGLAPGAGTESPSTSSTAETSVLAVHDLDPETVVVDPEAGAITVDGDAEVRDPIGGEVFDTPEFNSSAAGAAHEHDTGDQ